jgi:hypothetical protein
MEDNPIRMSGNELLRIPRQNPANALFSLKTEKAPPVVSKTAAFGKLKFTEGISILELLVL